MSTTFGATCEPFVKIGISPRYLVPLIPVSAQIGKHATILEAAMGKSPGRWDQRSRSWSGLGGLILSVGLRDSKQVQEFADWPTENVGLCALAYPGIDSDAESEDARAIVERALKEAFPHATYGIRIRGNNSRRLYLFGAYKDSPTRTRRITYELNGQQHKLDLQGKGTHCAIAGKHKSGDLYHWHRDYPIRTDLTPIEDRDIDRFIEIFQTILTAEGGLVTKKSGGGGGLEEAVDTTTLEPEMDPELVLAGLARFPNTPDTLPHRDDLVAALAAIRRALGREADAVRFDIFSWATQDSSWCSRDYFDQIWDSLTCVRVPPGGLDLLFRRNGITVHAPSYFNNLLPVEQQVITAAKDQKREAKTDILAELASQYIFGSVNTREGIPAYSVRQKWAPEIEVPAWAWWREEVIESNKNLIARLREMDAYNKGKSGFANLLRDLRDRFPEIWYVGETRRAGADYGEVVKEGSPTGRTLNLINMWSPSDAILEARKPDPDPTQSQKDVDRLLDFVNRMFGSYAKYELDTAAYMVQTGDRPGHGLFMVGDSGVGKSLYTQLMSAIFDGVGPGRTAIVDGAKLANENSRRFIWGGIEGCRIIAIRELPKNTPAAAREMAMVTSQLKQLVDAGPEGDYVTIERKGENNRSIRNSARIIISSNYANSLQIESQDRRIFFVQCGITLDNKPDGAYYAELADIINSPSRLAAFWRYLRSRDINGYNRHTPPPVSLAKAERQAMAYDTDAQRHMAAAVAWLKASDRSIFTIPEVARVMTKCAELEGDSTVYNDLRDSQFMTAARVVLRKPHAHKLERQFRTSDKRGATIYVLGNQLSLVDDLMGRTKDEIQDLLENEENRVLGDHPWPMYQNLGW